MVEGVKETIYLKGVLMFLEPELESPRISVFEDNNGAKALAENPPSSSKSKLVDVRLRSPSRIAIQPTCRLVISQRKHIVLTFSRRRWTERVLISPVISFFV